MKKWFQRNLRTIVTFSFIIPIVVVALVSISHVTEWYKLSNPLMWAIYLSIGIEIAALSSLSAISVNMGKKVYIPFIIVTVLQLIGNVFFSYNFIDVNSHLFKSWVELTSPIVEFLGVDNGDIIGHKRFLALFSGGLLPIVSLSFLHMLVTLNDEKNINQLAKPPIFYNPDNSNILKKMKDKEISNRVDKISEPKIKIENGHVTGLEYPDNENKVEKISEIQLKDGHVTGVKTEKNQEVTNPVEEPNISIPKQSRYSKYTYGPKRNN